jgi:peptide/nickel transport system permease protein
MPQFIRYVGRKVGLTLVTLLLLTVVIFALTNVLPGDAAVVALGGQAGNEEALDAMRERLGLNQPLYAQYLDWVGGALRGDLGESLRFDQEVSALVADKLSRSLFLAGAATVVSIGVSIPLGVYAAVNKNEPEDVAASFISFAGISVPEFLWGLVLILVFAVYLDIFPTGGYVSPLVDPLGALYHVTLPALSLGITLSAYMMRMTRSSMIEVLREEYIQLARAKGLSRRAVVLHHALKNALIPVITVAAFQFAYSFGAIVVIEDVFSWPGIGQLTVTAINNRDLPLIQATVLTIALVYLVVNTLADVLYGYVDPRIRVGGEQ